MQAQQLTITVERLNGDIRSITEQISGSESRIAVLENDMPQRGERRRPAAGDRGRGADRSEAAARWNGTAPWQNPWRQPGRSWPRSWPP